MMIICFFMLFHNKQEWKIKKKKSNCSFCIISQEEKDLHKDVAKKADVSNALENGLTKEMKSHLPGYNPYEKSYTNASLETESHF